MEHAARTIWQMKGTSSDPRGMTQVPEHVSLAPPEQPMLGCLTSVADPEG